MNTLSCRLVGSWNFRACCWLLCLAVAPQTFGDLVGVEPEIRTDLTICQDTSQDSIDEPLTVCSLYIVFDDPTDRILSVSNVDITTSDPDGFFQHPFGNGSISPACNHLPVFPDLICDSFVTIGVECSDGNDGSSTDPDFDPDEFNNDGHIVGGWFNANPPSGQGDAGAYPDGRVLLAQFSATEGENTYGELDLHIRVGLEFITAPHIMFDCLAGPCLRSICPSDVDRDGVVGSTDLATLLGAWGPCDNGPCRCVDGDHDGHIGPADLAQLLDNWGLCP